MSKIIILPFASEKKDNGISKVYKIGDVEVTGLISRYCNDVEPLRVLGHVLRTKGINFSTTIEGSGPWDITQMAIDEKDADYAKIALAEIMEYRFSVEAERNWKEIIRQLPFDVLMEVSDIIMNYGVKTKQQEMNSRISSDTAWATYDRMYPGYITAVDSKLSENVITIPTDQPTLRKHLIYSSSRGGYNIKTQGYEDGSRDHHCYLDSKKWD